MRSRDLPLQPSPHSGRLGSRPARDPLPSAPKRALRLAAGLRITLLLGGDREVDVDLAIVGPLAGLHERARREAIGTARGLRAGHDRDVSARARARWPSPATPHRRKAMRRAGAVLW